MKNLFNLDELSKSVIIDLFKKASILKKQGINNWIKLYPEVNNLVISLMFFEPSTRTEYSFQVAASKLGMHVINFNIANSSALNKTETLYDTVKTFEAIQADIAVIRHFDTNYYEELTKVQIPLINGGDGTGRHPTQALLDLYTIYEEYDGAIQDKKALIIGDIMNSRVAKTNIMIMEKFGMTVKVTGPEQFADPIYKNITVYSEETINQSDIIMLLRYQFERHARKFTLNSEVFRKKWQLTKEKYNNLKPNAIIMHPGPVNRGIEIDGDLVEAPKSRILHQVTNGVYIRAALILELLGLGDKIISSMQAS